MAAEIDGTSKGLLGAFAVFALGSGIASLIYGVLLLLRYMVIEYNYGAFNLYSISILLIVVGGLLIITVFLGIIGALKDVSNLRVVTLVLLFILFAILTVIGVWGMVSFKTGRLQQSIDTDFKTLAEAKSPDADTKKRVDYLHQTYNCCTVYSTSESRSNDLIPDSCCIVPGCADTTVYGSKRYFENGCGSVYFGKKAVAVFHSAILVLVAAGLVLFALVFYGVVSQRARAGYAVVSRG
jgi:hypothetical protein